MAAQIPARDWQRQGACSDPALSVKALDKVFFPDGETARAAKIAEAAFCGFCPVRADCLTYAIDAAPYGLYAGTTPAQRRAMGRKRDRVKCPTCATPDPVVVVGVAEDVMVTTQFCRGCGSSWITSTISVEILDDDMDADLGAAS